MKHLFKLSNTTGHDAGLIARISLAVVIFPHGAQLLLGWFGGYGYAGTMQYLTTSVGLPSIVAFMVILLQCLLPILMIAGIATRLLGLATIALFSGMIFTSHTAYGFFMNWSGQHSGDGSEYHLLVIGLSMVLLVSGAGKWSVDRLITRHAHP